MRHVLLASSCLLLSGISLLFAGCGGSQSELPVPAPTAPLHGTVTPEQAVAEINTAVAPAGVDAALFAELQSELVRVVLETSRNTALAPQGDHNAVDDLVLLGSDADGWRLEWTVRNTGDYDRNGEVNASDLAKIGLYYQYTHWSTDWGAAQYADGDSNGEINVSDVTPIGQNFSSAIVGYRVLGADTEAGPETLIGEADLPPTPQTGQWLVSYGLSSNDYEVYRVEPVDSGGIIGMPSLTGVGSGEAAEVSLGADIVQSSATIGTGGGGFAGTAGTPLEGITLSFPPDALFSDETVEFGWNNGTITPVDGVFVPPIIEFGGPAVGGFFRKVEITVPLTGGEDYVPVLYDIRDDGSLNPMHFEEIDYTGGTATFSTMHASKKAIINAPTHFTSIEQISKLDTGFKPGVDGFKINNLGSSWNQSGECLGMTGFSKWYYATRQYSSHGRLYNSFLQSMGVSGKLAQNIIATRAQTSTHYAYLNGFHSESVQRTKLSPIRNFAMMRGALLEGKQPILLGLNTPETAVGHSVLAYAMLPNEELLGRDGMVLRIYDPSFPGTTQSIYLLKDVAEPDWDEAVFDVYTGPVDYNFDSFVLDGDGSIPYYEPFDSILTDALVDPPFGGVPAATITLTSHKQDEEVTDLEQIISGSIQDSELMTVEIIALSRSDWVQYEDLLPNREEQLANTWRLPLSGEFNLPITLFPGKNHVTFFAAGPNANGKAVVAEYRLLGQGFEATTITDLFWLYAPITPAEITITSHSVDEHVSGDEIVLSGTINSPDINLAGIELFIDQPVDHYSPGFDSRDYNHPYNTWGERIHEHGECRPVIEFLITVPLPELVIRDGKTHLYFKTYGQINSMDGGGVSIEINEIDNNYVSQPFTLIVDQGPGPGQVRFDVEIEARYQTFSRTNNNKPALGLPGPSGTTWVGYSVRGDLGAEPFALWEDLTEYDEEDEAEDGKIRITASNNNDGKYTISLSAPVNGDSSIRATRVIVSGIASGSFDVSNGAPNMGETWLGVQYDSTTGVLELLDHT